MSIAAGLFAGLKAASQDGVNPERVKVVGGNDAAGSALGAIADAQVGTHNAIGDKSVEQGAALAQFKKIGPGDADGITDTAGGAAVGAGQRHHAFLVGDGGKGTEQD